MRRSETNPLAPTEAILESISDGVFTVDHDWRITSFNRAAEAITGITRDQALGQRCSEVFRSSMCGDDCALRQTLKTGKPVIGRAGYIVDSTGKRIPISVSTAVMRDVDGRVMGGAETFRDLSEVEALREALDGRFRIGNLISHSAAMRRVFEILPTLAATTSTVLIEGETGTGKELLARAIHTEGTRRDKPFIAVNCGALPDSLLESELFGYKAGAFTGATRDKPGRFALAEGGTLFLDEIGEVSPSLQVRLLRVLQERTYEPLGATRTSHADVRIIAATHRDLRSLVSEGVFREDLFYRINVVRVQLPPLRARKEDIPLLVEHFIGRLGKLQRKPIRAMTGEAMERLMAHDWPGNIRELENAIEHAFVLCTGERIDVPHLPAEFSSRVSPSVGKFAAIRQQAEADSIRDVLVRNRYNRAAAALELGIHKSTLYRRMKALGIHLPEQDGRSR
jgi:PAS domain S-box-containing protein